MVQIRANTPQRESQLMLMVIDCQTPVNVISVRSVQREKRNKLLQLPAAADFNSSAAARLNTQHILTDSHVIHTQTHTHERTHTHTQGRMCAVQLGALLCDGSAGHWAAV